MAARPRTASASCAKSVERGDRRASARAAPRSACRPTARRRAPTTAIPKRCSSPRPRRWTTSASPSSNCASRRPTARSARTDVPKLSPKIRKVFNGPLILNSGLHARGGAGRRSIRAWPTRSPSGARSSPTPTWSSACAPGAPLDAGQCQDLVHARGRRAISTIRRSKPKRRNPVPPPQGGGYSATARDAARAA